MQGHGMPGHRRGEDVERTMTQKRVENGLPKVGKMPKNIGHWQKALGRILPCTTNQIKEIQRKSKQGYGEI